MELGDLLESLEGQERVLCGESTMYLLIEESRIEDESVGDCGGLCS